MLNVLKTILIMLRNALSASRSTTISLRSRSLHSTPVAYKTVTEKVSEVADTVSFPIYIPFLVHTLTSVTKVNKKVGKGLASAIESGQEVTEKTKEKTSEASNVASQKSNQVRGRGAQSPITRVTHLFSQAAAGAKEAKEDFKKEVKK